MAIYLSHDSALEFWRSGMAVIPIDYIPHSIREYAPTLLQRYNLERCDLGDCRAPIKHALVQGDSGIFSKPLHVLTTQREQRRPSSRLHYHLCSTPLPPGQFIALGPEVAVSSPELLFFQMAAVLDMPSLVLLGMELCGYYSLDPHDPRGFSQHQPFTHVAWLKHLGERLEGRGRVKGMKALDYVVDGTASPAESKLAAFLCLPYRSGGCELPLPRANVRMQLSAQTRRSYGWSVCTCDLCWFEHRFAIEYQGGDHDAPERRESDIQKSLILRAEGFDCVLVDFAQLVDGDKRNALAEVVANAVGKPLRPAFAKFEEQRAALAHAFWGA